jgi:hypothetical protein
VNRDPVVTAVHDERDGSALPDGDIIRIQEIRDRISNRRRGRRLRLRLPEVHNGIPDWLRFLAVIVVRPSDRGECHRCSQHSKQ